MLVSQHGADTHRLDPLADLEISIDAQRAVHAELHTLAHDQAGGRWLLTGGGGYDLVQVVPRTWTHLLAEAAGQTSASCRDYVAQRTGLAAPEHMTDGTPAQFKPFESGYNPSDPVDRAIMATRNAVFPLHGLMPQAAVCGACGAGSTGDCRLTLTDTGAGEFSPGARAGMAA